MPIAGGVPVGPSPTPEQQLDALQGQAAYLEESLTEVRQRIEELRAAKKDT